MATCRNGGGVLSFDHVCDEEDIVALQEAREEARVWRQRLYDLEGD